MSRYFYKTDADPIVREVTINDVTIGIQVNGDGVFYAKFSLPTLLLKGRGLPKLAKAVEEEIRARGKGICVPFTRVRLSAKSYFNGQSQPIPVAEIEHHAVRLERGHNAYFLNDAIGEQPITTRYNDEVFLRLLSPEEIDEIKLLHSHAVQAQNRVDTWLEEREFDYKAAKVLQKEGKYPTELPASVELEAEE